MTKIDLIVIVKTLVAVLIVGAGPLIWAASKGEAAEISTAVALLLVGLPALFALTMCNERAIGKRSAMRGMAALDEKRWKDAEDAFRDAMATSELRPWARGALGVALYRQGRFQEAHTALREALSAAPQAEWIRENLEWVRARLAAPKS